MKLQLEKCVPPGVDHRYEIKWIIVGMIASLIFSLRFVFLYSNQYDELYRYTGGEKHLIDGAVMPDYIVTLGNSLIGFLVIAACMIGVIVYHYIYHYQGSRSIYLMKRLPDRFVLWKRCIALPVLAAAANLCTAVAVLVLYYVIYILATPKVCLAPDQWQKIWSFLL